MGPQKRRSLPICRALLSLLCLGTLAGKAAADQVAPAPGLVRETLAGSIYLFRASSELDFWTATNTVVIVNDDDVTVFDSSTRPATARLVIAEIRKLTGKPVRTLINSHWHMDHWGGNGEYARAFPGLRIIATVETRDYMSRMGGRFFADEVGVDRSRAALEAAIRSGKQGDGTPLTPELRSKREARLEETVRIARELEEAPRVLPNLVYRDALTFWSGTREFRLWSATGDASGSTVLYLPGDQVLVMGDVLVSPEDGNGPPPWTTNSYAVTPWLESLRRAEALDATVIVPGQGPAFRDQSYLRVTRELFEGVIGQVHAALERGAVKLSEVQATVNLDAVGRRYPPGGAQPSAEFRSLVTRLVRKAHQEALDGAANGD